MHFWTPLEQEGRRSLAFLPLIRKGKKERSVENGSSRTPSIFKEIAYMRSGHEVHLAPICVLGTEWLGVWHVSSWNETRVQGLSEWRLQCDLVQSGATGQRQFVFGEIELSLGWLSAPLSADGLRLLHKYPLCVCVCVCVCVVCVCESVCVCVCACACVCVCPSQAIPRKLLKSSSSNLARWPPHTWECIKC